MTWEHDGQFYEFRNMFYKAIDIVRRHRDWYSRELLAHDLHPLVVRSMRECRPYNWQQLLLEYPHKSQDGARIAYTQNDRKGEANIQTVTSLGKYLTRHFALPDHVIRDFVALYVGSGACSFVRTKDDMIHVITNGPTSCMSKSADYFGGTHPYAVYDPKYGWHMAVRKNGDRIDGRALCLHDDEEGPIFVRSYKRDPSEGYSHSDETLEAWLKSQGYTKHAGWPEGAKVARIEGDDGRIMMPYVDGRIQRVDDRGTYLRLSEDGELDASNTDGSVSGGNDVACDDCGDMYDEDDHDWTWVGLWQDRRVCTHCADNYTYAYGRRGEQYHEHGDECSYCPDNGEYYVNDYLSDNDMVELYNGDITHSDNAVFIEAHDEYHHWDSDRICYAEDTDRHELTRDCWQCTATDKWYTDDEDSVEIDGDLYHPDNAPETTEGESE